MIRRIKGAKYLTKPTQPLQVDRDRSVPGLLDKMEHISLQGRNLALAQQLWLSMLQDNSVVFMGLSGALIPAGMRRLVAYLIKNRCVDVLVTTGANIFHDLHETLGRHHYIGDPKISDAELHEEKVDRMYDTFASEEEFKEAYEWIGGFATQFDNTHAYSTREFLHLLGRELSEIATEDGILTAAFKSRVPIFCPAITDSAFGVAIGLSRIEKKNPFQFDVIQDVVDMAQIVAKSRSTGVVNFGGGTTKTFIQQSEAAAAMLHNQPRGHKYAVQIITEGPEYGSYSGAEFEQSSTFGRLSKQGKSVTVRCDATIAMPLLVTSLSQTASKAMRTRKRIQFGFGQKDLQIAAP
ncbi:MAG: deoxyhypusine synthase [Acidobacteria bacterium]|nr:deoxyhypusine synthase [Acidobacteriota bacterium]